MLFKSTEMENKVVGADDCRRWPDGYGPLCSIFHQHYRCGYYCLCLLSTVVSLSTESCCWKECNRVWLRAEIVCRWEKWCTKTCNPAATYDQSRKIYAKKRRAPRFFLSFISGQSRCGICAPSANISSLVTFLPHRFLQLPSSLPLPSAQ